MAVTEGWSEVLKIFVWTVFVYIEAPFNFEQTLQFDMNRI